MDELEMLKEAIMRDSWTMLDNVGISVSLSELPATKEIAEISGELYPKPILKRILLKVRPRYRRGLMQRKRYWRKLQKQQLINRVMDEGLKMTERHKATPPRL